MAISGQTSFYSGISFPPRRGNKGGFFAISTDQQLIEESIYVILNTRKGEMPMNPSFGTSMDDNLFDALDTTVQGVLCQQLQSDINAWEPRVTVNSITCYTYEEVRLFNIVLTINLTGQQFTTSVPFNGS